MNDAPRTASGIQDVHEFAGGVFSGELEKNILEPFCSSCRLRAQLFHRSERANFSGLNDSNSVAHRLGNFERVRRHHDSMSAACVLAEKVLQNARCFWIESNHWLVDDDDIGLVNERARDDELLPHSVAVALDQLVAPFIEIEECQQFTTA